MSSQKLLRKISQHFVPGITWTNWPAFRLNNYQKNGQHFVPNTAKGTKHYVRHGYRESRSVDSFDEWSYLASHSDLLDAFGSNTAKATEHYVLHGYGESRSVDSFNAERYLSLHSDLQAAFGNDTDAATIHYVRHGYGEGRAV